jgi:hypothetical protein
LFAPPFSPLYSKSKPTPPGFLLEQIKYGFVKLTNLLTGGVGSTSSFLHDVNKILQKAIVTNTITEFFNVFILSPIFILNCGAK